MIKRLWQQTFKDQNLYEAARLDLMVKLTERVILAGYSGHDFLREQVIRLKARADEFRQKAAKTKKVDKKSKRR